MDKYENLINNISKGTHLTLDESKFVFLKIMSGSMKDELINNFLINLSIKGETAEEIAGGVFTLREKALKVETSVDAVDTCGTGGDGKNTLNISTASSILLSSIGIKIAKHGNKALSSKCGSADVLEKLNININLKPNDVVKRIKENNFGFMFAPNYHAAMKYVAPVRKKIAKRTIFNLVGPLSSPANVKRQVVGVYSEKWLKPFAEALKKLNSTHVWIVHSSDGMDEISPFAPTKVVELKDNIITEKIINPNDVGINFKNMENLIGKDSEYNAKKIVDIFSGIDNEFSDAVCLNAAAGLIVSGKIISFNEAYKLAKEHILSSKVLSQLKKIQN
tara:strand:+ start:531 stop:1532 length:1002 start_codon:yes stop_codon:yes gene_type:complete